MTLRIATFNAENLMQRFDFSGWGNEMRRDRTLHMLDVKDEKHFQTLEQARVVAHTDDTMQLTALAVADCRADILCMQEVENLDALNAFEYGYLFKMAGHGYRHKYLVEGNDRRGIDVCVMMRDETATGEKIEFVSMKSHAKLTYKDLGIHNKALAETGNEPNERIFRRDCLEIDVKVGGVSLRFIRFILNPWVAVKKMSMVGRGPCQFEKQKQKRFAKLLKSVLARIIRAINVG